jgi:hypothetical protein
VWCVGFILGGPSHMLHDNNGVIGFFRNATPGPEIGTMVALKTPHDVQKIFLVVWRGKV